MSARMFVEGGAQPVRQTADQSHPQRHLTVLRWFVRLVTLPLLPLVAVVAFVSGSIEGWQNGRTR